MSRIDIPVIQSTNQMATYVQENLIVQTETGAIYVFYIDTNTDPGYKKSTDYGRTWSAFVQLKACTCDSIAVWYDGWSGITETSYIHVAYTENSADDTYYRTINTASSDALGTERTVFSGSSAASGGILSITRARGGNVMVATCIDAGAEYDTTLTTDLGATWTSPAEVLEAATTDQVLLLPGWNADTQDIMAIFLDASASQISVKRFDDSANSWAETSIATSVTMTAPSSSTQNLNFRATVDLANSQNILVFWTVPDTANADLRCFKINDTTITETAANVVLNSVDDQGNCAIAICSITGLWTVSYFGNSDGSDSVSARLSMRYKTSSDSGATWSAETEFIIGSKLGRIFLFTPLICYNGHLPVYWGMYIDNTIQWFVNVTRENPKASYQLGI